MSVQSRVPFGTFKLKLLLDFSSLPISSSMKGKDWAQYRRNEEAGQLRLGADVIVLRVIACRRTFWRCAGRKWGEMSRMSRKVTQPGTKRAPAGVQSRGLARADFVMQKMGTGSMHG